MRVGLGAKQHSFTRTGGGFYGSPSFLSYDARRAFLLARIRPSQERLVSPSPNPPHRHVRISPYLSQSPVNIIHYVDLLEIIGSDVYAETRRLMTALQNSGAFGPGMTVLDLGCGPGFFLKEAATVSSTGQHFGVDRSARMVDHAIRHVHNPDNAVAPKIRKADIREPSQLRAGLRLSAGATYKFDLIVCTNVLAHIDPHDHRRLITEWAEYLNPGRHMLISRPYYSNVTPGRVFGGDHIHTHAPIPGLCVAFDTSNALQPAPGSSRSQAAAGPRQQPVPGSSPPNFNGVVQSTSSSPSPPPSPSHTSHLAQHPCHIARRTSLASSISYRPSLGRCAHSSESERPEPEQRGILGEIFSALADIRAFRSRHYLGARGEVIGKKRVGDEDILDLMKDLIAEPVGSIVGRPG